MIDKMTPEQLNEFIKNYSEYQEKPGEEEVKQKLIDRARNELKKRKRFSFAR